MCLTSNSLNIGHSKRFPLASIVAWIAPIGDTNLEYPGSSILLRSFVIVVAAIRCRIGPCPGTVTLGKVYRTVATDKYLVVSFLIIMQNGNNGSITLKAS